MRSGVFTITCTDRDCDSRSPNPCVSAINSSRNRNLCSKTCDTVEQTCVLWRLTLRSMTVIPWANLPATRNLIRLRQHCPKRKRFLVSVKLAQGITIMLLKVRLQRTHFGSTEPHVFEHKFRFRAELMA